MKINLGSGYKRYPDFINVDSDTNCSPDYLINIDDKDLVLPFEDNSVTNIIAHHILEHIGEGYIKLLQEIYRICKSGALIDIRVPHPFHETFLNDPTHKRPIMVEGFRLFSKKANQHEIEHGGTSSTLGLMYDVDFEIVSFEYIHDPYYDQIKQTLNYQELERLFREALNVALEIHIIITVIK